MKRIRQLLEHIRKDQRGLETIEIALIAAIVVIFALAGWQFLGGKIKSALQTVGSKLDQAGQTNPGSW